MRSNLQTFAAVLARNMREVRARDPLYYGWPESETDRVAVKLTGGLLMGGANKAGAAIKATLRELAIRDTYKAIKAYLEVAPSIEWKCATCKAIGVPAIRLPLACGLCGSERDAAHGPQPLTAADLIAAVRAEEIALEAAQRAYQAAEAIDSAGARRDFDRAQELHTHLARRLAIPFEEVR